MTQLPQADDPIGHCLAGDISPQVALCRLLLAGAGPETIAAGLAARRPRDLGPRWQALHDLLEQHAATLQRLAGEVAANGRNHSAADPDARAGIARIAAFFDQAVAHSPAASVALYSLGDEALLGRATAEIVAWLTAQRLLGPDRDVLDLGCGIGRVALAIAPLCRSLLGLDVSAGMVAEARRRCAGRSNLRFETTSGCDLATLPAAAFDLVLAVDSFPYIVQAGAQVADRHIADAASALRPGGALAILNLSYGRPPETDRADIEAWAARHGLVATTVGLRPFTLWDGAAFVLRR